MTTVATILSDSAMAGNFIGQDQTLTNNDGQLLLRILQRLLDSWSNEHQLIFQNTTQSFLMTPSVASYSTALFPNGRPVAITSMTVTLSNIIYSVDLIDVMTWNDIGYKIVDSIPNQCYYDAGFPDGTLNFYPRPYAAFTCSADCNYPLTGTLLLGTDLVLPPGYEAAIIDSLVIEAWQYFKTGNPSPTMIQNMKDRRAAIKRTNFQPMEMVTPFDGGFGDVSNAFLYKGF